MLKLRLKEVAQLQRKSISQIAKETGINRNTIASLINNQVDGIKFSTVEKICQVYHLKIEDLFWLSNNNSNKEAESDQYYRGEAEAVPFTCWPWMLVNDQFDPKFFQQGIGDLWVYFKENFASAYWRKTSLNQSAEIIYQKYSDKKKFQTLFDQYLLAAKQIINLYYQTEQRQVLAYSQKLLVEYFHQVIKAYEKFWQLSAFIESFDASYDDKIIKNISKRYDLSVEDLATLTTPYKMTFNNERIFRLLKLAREISKLKAKAKNSKFFLGKFLKDNPEVERYRKDFNYYQSTYANVREISISEINKEINRYLEDPSLMESEYNRLANYSKDIKQKQDEILKKIKEKTNPLEFFSQLTFWREHRKMVNLMGIHLLNFILDALEVKTGINKQYLNYLSFDEVALALKGLISQKVLEQRYSKGIMVLVSKNDFKILNDAEANSLKNELDNSVEATYHEKIIYGQVASSGYAKGIAKVILSPKNFNLMSEGDILVTSMTRPEFVPIMKIAAGIVTNEGGITCHAAIVSRELKKPCIIGTRNATQLIHNGDLIEVRANHGTVRILS